ncbi:hypothetical protein VCHA53O464_10143 [Vibrio chagasii]|nr:hypothetical protein VCHA53O464_10143 [Vibrio chagasii]
MSFLILMFFLIGRFILTFFTISVFDLKINCVTRLLGEHMA